MHFKRIEQLLLKKLDESQLVRILLEYASLKQKLEAPDHQTWYFKKGLASNTERLARLQKDYGAIRDFFNETSVDLLMSGINRNTEIMTSYDRNGMNSIQGMHYTSLKNEITYFKELIRLKSCTDLLMPIDHYLENPDEFLEIMG